MPSHPPKESLPWSIAKLSTPLRQLINAAIASNQATQPTQPHQRIEVKANDK